MTKEEKQYVLDALRFALDKGTFDNVEHSYNTLANAINVIDNEPTSEGWIKINSEDDLPKDNNSYWVVMNGKVNIAKYQTDFKKWLCKEHQYFETHIAVRITHYQAIEKPSLPIY